MAGDTSDPKRPRRTASGWVIGTTLLISWIGFSSQIFIVLPSFPNDSLFSVPVLKILGPFNFLLFLVFYNYYLCIRTNPGTVPAGWDPYKYLKKHGTLEVKPLSGALRYCKVCQAYKPPRSHHCKTCKKCVLKMDHHCMCPWISNCIGYYNYGHFIRFLISVDLATSYHLWMTTIRVFGTPYIYFDPDTKFIIILILNMVTCAPVWLAVGAFSLYHIWCMMWNTTTIEGMEKERSATLIRKGRVQSVKYPYDVGVFRNIKSVLGNNPIVWLVPQEQTSGDGVWYPTGDGIDPQEQLFWPPLDEYLSQTDKQRKSRKRDFDERGPFTYGNDLNPELYNDISFRRKPSKWSSLPPYHPDYRANQSQEDVEYYSDKQSEREMRWTNQQKEEDGLSEYDDDDDVPLGLRLRQRRLSEEVDASCFSGPEVRVRRGSEGYEVRPMFQHQQVEEWYDHDGEEGKDNDIVVYDDDSTDEYED